MTAWATAPQTGLLTGLLAALSVVLAIRQPARLRPDPTDPPGGGHDADVGWLRRWRWWWSALAGAAVATFFSGVVGLVGGVAAAVGAWMLIGRSEPASQRRRREAVEQDLPALVHLLAAALAAGGAVGESLALVCDSYPGVGADLLRGVARRLLLGLSPGEAWASVQGELGLAPLARTLVRADRSGASVAEEVARLADDLARRSRSRVEERARAVGVKAAVPLGICLLPAFILLGIVPLVVALLESLAL